MVSSFQQQSMLDTHERSWRSRHPPLFYVVELTGSCSVCDCGQLHRHWGVAEEQKIRRSIQSMPDPVTSLQALAWIRSLGRQQVVDTIEENAQQLSVSELQLKPYDRA